MNMNTTIVGLKEFRDNISAYAKETKDKNRRFVIFKKNTPMFEVIPAFGAGTADKSLLAGYLKGKEDIKKGRVYTQKQVKKILGLLR